MEELCERTNTTTIQHSVQAHRNKVAQRSIEQAAVSHPPSGILLAGAESMCHTVTPSSATSAMSRVMRPLRKKRSPVRDGSMHHTYTQRSCSILASEPEPEGPCGRRLLRVDQACGDDVKQQRQQPAHDVQDGAWDAESTSPVREYLSAEVETLAWLLDKRTNEANEHALAAERPTHEVRNQAPLCGTTKKAQHRAFQKRQKTSWNRLPVSYLPCQARIWPVWQHRPPECLHCKGSGKASLGQ